MSSKPLALLLVMIDIDPSIDDDELNRWYFEEHIAERLACPGFVSARRFGVVEGKPKYLAIYELESPEALDTEEYRSLMHSPLIGDNVPNAVGSERTRRMLNGFRNVVRNVYIEIDPADYPPAGDKGHAV